MECDLGCGVAGSARVEARNSRRSDHLLNGERVSLRPALKNDADFFFELANDMATRQTLVGWSLPVSQLEHEEWFASSAFSRSQVRFVIESPTGEPLGTIALADLDDRNRSARTPIKMLPEFRSRGFGTDALMTLMAWAFTDVGLRRLHASILDFNAASIRAFTGRCGYRVEGVERQAVLRNRRWCDRYILGILVSEFIEMDSARAYVDRLGLLDVESVYEP
jgi:RimJ/RimL family protein N-acetyltransferase